MWTDEQIFLNKKGIVVSQKNCPRLYVIFWMKKEMFQPEAVITPIPTTKKFNIKHDYDNAIPVGNPSTHANLIIDNQHEKAGLKNIYRTKSGRIVKKPNRFIDEIWHDLFLTSGCKT